MEHRKRNQMQHKVSLSTLLHITISKQKSNKAVSNKTNQENLVKTLAYEALKSLKTNDHAVIIKQTIL